jgi:hypothetical protein
MATESLDVISASTLASVTPTADVFLSRFAALHPDTQIALAAAAVVVATAIAVVVIAIIKASR